MKIKSKIILCIIATIFLALPNINVYASETNTDLKTLKNDLPSAVIVNNSDPFYALIATPLAVFYDDVGEKHVIPLYVKDYESPSKAVIRTMGQIDRNNDMYEIDGSIEPKEISIEIAETFWEKDATPNILLLEDSMKGYNLGIVATPLASYMHMPIVVTDYISPDVQDMLDTLGVETAYVCGDIIHPASSDISFIDIETVEQAVDIVKTTIESKQWLDSSVKYVTMANPLDITYPQVLNTTEIEFSGKVTSSIGLPTQFFNMMVKKGTAAVHDFSIPKDYKYAHLKIDLTNLDSEFSEELGDRMFLTVASPDGERYIYASTGGGIPDRDKNGDITKDRIHFESTIYNKTGEYSMQVLGQWFAAREGEYRVKITIEKLGNALVPLMPGLSSMAPYLTAFHMGVVFANTSFAFAADDTVIYNGTTCNGVSQPGTNPLLIEASNNHTMKIHDELNNLLADIADINQSHTEELRNYYLENPMYIAITADPTMVPMYFYYNPDGKPDEPAHIMGFAVPSDYIYADIDPKSDDQENNTYSYWPMMENVVGRVTGWDVQDCSALIARTIFYNEIIDELDGWKNNAVVQTGCGLEFQNLPIATRLSQILYSGRGEPTKFPTGESYFINNRLKDAMSTGGYNVTNTIGLQSQRQGFTKDDLQKIKQLGPLNQILFPARFIELINGEDKITGGYDQLNSSFIFTFAHGFYNLYEAGDILIDSRGFPPATWLSRIYPVIRSSLSTKGSYDLRAIENDEYGPSIIFVESCITGRTDGIMAKNLLSQTYLHAGVNAFIGATRVTADPGYLEPRPLPGGWGIGALGLTKAIIDKAIFDKYPDLHFGAVIAEDFIYELIQNDTTTGLALRNAKNMYLEKDANSTFLWTPPLNIKTGNSIIDREINSLIEQPQINGNTRTRTLDKKYVALHEFQLYGDPAFNPYQPINNG